MTASLTKARVVQQILATGQSVFVHLDGEHAGAILPAHLKNSPHVVLQIGHDLPIPIPDLRLDECGVVATLSFRREAFTCAWPWTAVFAVVDEDGNGAVWQECAPACVVRAGGFARADESAVRPVHRSERSYLRRVK
jgi:hypothetical protein